MDYAIPPQPHEITKPTACIVTFADQPGPRAVHYEVVIDPRQKSPSGRMIRMDSARGCEIHGWQAIDAIRVVEVLREFEPEEFDAALQRP